MFSKLYNYFIGIKENERIHLVDNLEMCQETETFIEQKIPIILDPVMIATSKDRLIKENAIEFLKNNFEFF